MGPINSEDNGDEHLYCTIQPRDISTEVDSTGKFNVTACPAYAVATQRPGIPAQIQSVSTGNEAVSSC